MIISIAIKNRATNKLSAWTLLLFPSPLPPPSPLLPLSPPPPPLPLGSLRYKVPSSVTGGVPATLPHCRVAMVTAPHRGHCQGTCTYMYVSAWEKTREGTCSLERRTHYKFALKNSPTGYIPMLLCYCRSTLLHMYMYCHPKTIHVHNLCTCIVFVN